MYCAYYIRYLGLSHAYSAGVLHRDVSVGNILILPRNGANDPWGALIDLDLGILHETHVTLSNDERTVRNILTPVT